MHKDHTIMNEVNIQSFKPETKIDAGLNNSGMTFYVYCNIVEIRGYIILLPVISGSSDTHPYRQTATVFP